MIRRKNILSEIDNILATPWNIRDGRRIPSSDSILLGGGAVAVDAAYLYADLADSSKMAAKFDKRVTAKILKSFLSSSAKIIEHHGGTVMSFDGDRIMAAFIGELKCTSAVKAAFEISWAVQTVIRPKFEQAYKSVRKSHIDIRHATGVDFGEAFIVRAGARGTNDLVSIGRAPNVAAKLSDIRTENGATLITDRVFERMDPAVCKTRLDGGDLVWRVGFDVIGNELEIYYKTSYWRAPVD